MSHETPEYLRLPDGTYSVDTGVGRTIFAAPACWCRNCDHAAKADLSPLERIRAGAHFIVCPDCGNKRCPKGTNHELACTNCNEAGQPGSEWENVKPTGFITLTTEQVEAERRSAYAYAFTGPEAPAPPTTERLTQMQALRDDVRRKDADFRRPGAPGNFATFSDWLRISSLLEQGDELQRALVAATARAEKAEAALEVEKAKTALLWPVATKQAPAHDAE